MEVGNSALISQTKIKCKQTAKTCIQLPAEFSKKKLQQYICKLTIFCRRNTIHYSLDMTLAKPSFFLGATIFLPSHHHGPRYETFTLSPSPFKHRPTPYNSYVPFWMVLADSIHEQVEYLKTQEEHLLANLNSYQLTEYDYASNYLLL